MGTPCYVGVSDLAGPAIVRARYVHDGHPTMLIPQLRGIWATTTRRDTNALIEVVLAHDWAYLRSDITPDTHLLPGQHPVAGVGMTLGDTDPEPAAVFPLHRAADLGTSWIHLINPADSTVTVHSGDGEPVGIHRLGDPAKQQKSPGAACLFSRHAASGGHTVMRARRRHRLGMGCRRTG
ncbi:hypothetical protein [Micromonospora carbonacea]|uniref:Uncharacterized protein n=1 Tax=Micromonospora carbonacea TaxID=47853 RepID=A0A1C4YEF5_9ACTN|nr:hypothetical protein [Micromonospora carbonacea]SCF19050.1 hypothetical protein GA0070563_10658 [Micromonospora carbonacea]